MPYGFSPDTVTFSSSGYAYVADPASHKVVVLQYSSTSPYFTVATTYTGSSSFDPTTITTSSNGATAYVSDAGGTGDIDLFSISSGAFTYSSSISLSYTPATLAWNSNRTSLYVQLTGTTKMAVVTISSGLVTIVSLAVSAGPLGPAERRRGDPRREHVRLEPRAGRDLELGRARYRHPRRRGDGRLASVQNQLRYFAYVASSGSNNIQVIDLSGDNIRQGVTVGTAPDAVTVRPDGSMVYVANSGSSSVTADRPPPSATQGAPHHDDPAHERVRSGVAHDHPGRKATPRRRQRPMARSTSSTPTRPTARAISPRPRRSTWTGSGPQTPASTPDLSPSARRPASATSSTRVTPA